MWTVAFEIPIINKLIKQTINESTFWRARGNSAFVGVFGSELNGRTPSNTPSSYCRSHKALRGLVASSTVTVLLIHPQEESTMTEQRKAVIKNADMSEQMQQDAVDCASQAISKYNIEKVR